MSKRIKHRFLLYETLKEKDKFVKITQSMLSSKNFLSLHNSAKILYLYMKDWASGRIEFEYPVTLSKKFFGSNTTFRNCITELEQKGFIESEKRCKTTKNPNIYKFSSKWKEDGNI